MKTARRIEYIEVANLPLPGGHYSHAVSYGDLIFISGQLPVKPDGSHDAEAEFAEQALQAIENMLAILDAAGSNRNHLLKVTAYIVGIENWPLFNAEYAKLMGEALPARAIVPVDALHHGFLVELDAVAMRKPGQ